MYSYVQTTMQKVPGGAQKRCILSMSIKVNHQQKEMSQGIQQKYTNGLRCLGEYQVMFLSNCQP